MGIPIVRPDPDPLPCFKGYFSAHVTAHEVGSHSGDVFARHQREAAAAFVPLVSLDGGTLQAAWAGQRLHWVCGAVGEGAAFFRVHSCGQLEYLGTQRHPSPDFLDFADTGAAAAAFRPVSPGYVLYVPAEEVEDDSADEAEGYQDAPAVYVGGEPPELAPADRPSCLCCSSAMHFIGHCESDMFSDDIGECTVYLFYCHECQVQCCLEH